MAFDAEKRLIHFYTEFPYIDEDYTAYLLKRYDHTYYPERMIIQIDNIKSVKVRNDID